MKMNERKRSTRFTMMMKDFVPILMEHDIKVGFRAEYPTVKVKSFILMAQSTTENGTQVIRMVKVS